MKKLPRVPLPALIGGALLLVIAGWSLWPVGEAGADDSSPDGGGRRASAGNGVPMVRLVDAETASGTRSGNANQPNANKPGATPAKPATQSPWVRLPGDAPAAPSAAEAKPAADEVLQPRGADAGGSLAGPVQPGPAVAAENADSPQTTPATLIPAPVQNSSLLMTPGPQATPAGNTPTTAQPVSRTTEDKPTASQAPAGVQDAGVAAAVRKFEGGQRLAARAELNRMLTSARDEGVKVTIRAQLARMNEDLFFSPPLESGDPLFESYKLGNGEVLEKVSKRFDVPAGIIMKVNGVKDARRLRAGQQLKMPRGPFQARIDISDFRLDLYLQDTYIRSFPVGLGKDNGTPTGTWKVTERLKDPTYYPPDNAPNKKIVPPGPENPLGRFWIALEGVSGDAVGREGFGIHGTNEPHTVGRSASLGCVRMHADDIELLFGALQPGKSTVVIEP